MTTSEITPAQKAYGLLWRSTMMDTLVHQARLELCAALTKEERRAAVAWVLDVHGPMSTNQLIAADIRTELFPIKSF